MPPCCHPGCGADATHLIDVPAPYQATYACPAHVADLSPDDCRVYELTPDGHAGKEV